ncbi:MAG: GNAT family N-acetyltransferase [Candidatus Hodarchaeales archaeon]|jgi:ribosomal protein S18 acetylase RimI-like enzyme
MKENIIIRPAVVSDIGDLVRLRRIMFESMGFKDPNRLELADKASSNYFHDAIPSEQFFGWLAFSSTGEAVGSGGIVIDYHPPGPINLLGKIGYIMNLVVIPKFRRRGIARRLMQTMLNWLKDSDIQISSLHSTEDGRQLYEELGFENSNEMRLNLSYD